MKIWSIELTIKGLKDLIKSGRDIIFSKIRIILGCIAVVLALGFYAWLDSKIDTANEENEKERPQLIYSEPKGPKLGRWGTEEHCEPGSFAYKFQLDIEPYQGKEGLLPWKWKGKNDSAVNVIRLFCKNPKEGKNTNKITSSVGMQGKPSDEHSCDDGQYLFWYKSLLQSSGSIDISGYNGIRFGCRQYGKSGKKPAKKLLDKGLGYGSWTEKPALCKGDRLISGMQTRIGNSRVAVLDVRFICTELN